MLSFRSSHSVRFTTIPLYFTGNFLFRITLLSISVSCVFFTVILNVYMFKYRKLKVFKVASPIFLSITLLGCATMYLEVSSNNIILKIITRAISLWYICWKRLNQNMHFFPHILTQSCKILHKSSKYVDFSSLKLFSVTIQFVQLSLNRRSRTFCTFRNTFTKQYTFYCFCFVALIILPMSIALQYWLYTR